MSGKRTGSIAMAVAWPSFLMAGVLEMLVFSLVDPGQLHWFGGAAIEWSPMTVYSVAFIVFWIVISAASAMSHLLSESATEINSRTFR
jgi:hypothetical protein